MTRLAGRNTSGSVDGMGSAAIFSGPSGIAVSSSGTVYVADTYNFLVRMISSAGLKLSYIRIIVFVVIGGRCFVGVVTRLGGGGSAGGGTFGLMDGTGSAAMF